MKILIIGGGGREHALAWKAARSPLATQVFVAPGNAGTELENNLTNIDIGAEDIDALLAFAVDESIDLTIVGPEAPLVNGIVDRFERAGLKIFGPSAKAAQLEGSKTFTKDFLQRNNIPTAIYQSFTEVQPAIEYVKQQTIPIVIKADGLAAGKGVILAGDMDQAISTIEDMLAGNAFGDEACLADEALLFNTGGMGAYSPAPVVTKDIESRVMQDVIMPTVRGMANEGARYRGFLYAGLMIDQQGSIKVLEYNCRFGDPETQPIMMRLQSDLVELCLAACNGSLSGESAEWDPRSSLGVVLAANGYPDAYAKGEIISDMPEENENGKVFHAGTGLDKDGNIVSSGGRVLCAVALGEDIATAQSSAYELVRQINWDGAYYRSDIGFKAIK